jgi:tartrate-resistant acid phosphatase type 5
MEKNKRMRTPGSALRGKGVLIALVTPMLLTGALLSLLGVTTGTSAAPRPASTARFGIIGDYGLDGHPEAEVSDMVHGWKPDFVITVGDNNYLEGCASTIDANIGKYYHDFIFPYTGAYGQGAISNKFFPSLGNHDWGDCGPKPYFNYFSLPGNERYYDYSWGPVHFFALDSDPHEPDGTTITSTQALWLRSRLAAATERWKVVYFHHPPYTSGIMGSNTWMQWPFQQWGASVVLTGHDHNYERLRVNGFPYIVNGLGGADVETFGSPLPQSIVRYNSGLGAMLADAANDHITFQFMASQTGSMIDSLTLGTAVPTATPNGSPTITPTPCSVALSDVKATDYFYEPVKYLYCHGVIPGYIDSKFRPYNKITRGEAAKIIVQGQGWLFYIPPTPTFRDIPSTDPLFPFIETAAQHGIFSGYNCGAGCLQFLSEDSISRGQLAKVVVLSTGWHIHTPSTPTFADVQPGYVFYPHIETAYSKGLISGYSCGPICHEFRPDNDATRGQFSKILYNTVTYSGRRIKKD